MAFQRFRVQRRTQRAASGSRQSIQAVPGGETIDNDSMRRVHTRKPVDNLKRGLCLQARLLDDQYVCIDAACVRFKGPQRVIGCRHRDTRKRIHFCFQLQAQQLTDHDQAAGDRRCRNRFDTARFIQPGLQFIMTQCRNHTDGITLIHQTPD